MKKFFIFFFFFQYAIGQVTNLDCITAIQIFSGFSTTMAPNNGYGSVNDLQHPSNISNPQTNVTGVNAGCMLGDELNATWFIFTICNTGNLEFLIGSNTNQYPQMGFTDWSVWKYTSTTCSKIFNNQLAPLRCNWNGTTGGGTGICDTSNFPPGANNSNYESPLPVNAGDSLILCFSNYSGIYYSIDFLSVGTSSINCPIITAIAETQKIKSTSAFYNAASNQIELPDKNIQNIILHDVQGKEVYKCKTNEVNFINCGNFTPGLYFLTYTSESGNNVTEKIPVD